jgi:hypothetical protein
MSPRAACRLDTLGFAHVFDYMPGKVDWLARGLPREGEKAAEPRAVDYARRDVVTCALHDPAGAVREAIEASPYGFALVLDAAGVLLGRLRRSAIDAADDGSAEALMEPGPSTVRADAAPDRLRERLERGGLQTAVVTDPDGRLLGVARRADLSGDG